MTAHVSRKPSRLAVTSALIVALTGAVAAPLTAHAQIAALPTRDGIPTLAPLIEKAIPAVVNVSVKSKQQENPLLNDPMFRRFFEVPDGQERPRQRDARAAGSGFIVDAKKGYVLTNHHVVEDATEIVITLKDNRQLTAKKIGSDEATDVALLQVDAKGLTELPIGDSSKLQVGDFVVAIGNPFTLGHTVTSGIVSALGRSGLNIEGYEDFIQTDAAINPGNSGGPLINLKGEIVGMNTAILTGGGGNVGIGFAVPTSIISGVMDQLIQYGEVRRGQIGILIQDLTPDLAGNLGIPQNSGAIIQRVNKGSPGDKAGLKAGDVAIALNGVPLKSSGDLRNRVGLSQVDSGVTLTIIRDGQKKDIKVKLEKAPDTKQVAAIEEREALEGATFSDAEAGDNTKGAVVKQVQRGSPAWQIGLRERDVISAVNRKPIKGVEEFEQALKNGGRQVALSVKRGDEDLFLVIQ